MQVLGGWPYDTSGMGKTPSVPLMAMERAAEAGTMSEVEISDQRDQNIFVVLCL